MTLQVIEYDIDKIRPHPRNPRKHPDIAIERLKDSIEAYGFTNPILITQDGLTLAGAARLEAARQSGATTVPVIILPFEGDKALAYLIADNKLQELTDWDKPKLKDLLLDLDTGAFNIELTGFDIDEMQALIVDYEIDRSERTTEVQCPECGAKFKI